MISLLTRLLRATPSPPTTSASADRHRHRGRRDVLGVESLESRFALASGFEIAYVLNIGMDFKGPTQVYLAGGSNPMTDAAWASYEPPFGYLKNTTRNVEFNSQNVLTSPDSTTGETYIETSDGYTWLFVAETVSANWPFNPADYETSYESGYQAAALTTTPPDGVVKYSANTKNAIVTWLAKDSNGQPIKRYFIRDAWGNLYIMQTSGVADESAVEANFRSAVLPRGWRMFSGYLKRDLTTYPSYDSVGFAQFNIFRTSSDDAFQQIRWNGKGRSIAQQIPDMIIWGGPTSNTIVGRRIQRNVIHGGQGNDRIFTHNANDQIHGDAGDDTVVFRGRRSQYIVTRLTPDGSVVTVRIRRGGVTAPVTTLYNVERLRFQDRVERLVRLSRPLR